MLVNTFAQVCATEIFNIHKYPTAIFRRLFFCNFDIVLLIMGAHKLGTLIKVLYQLVSVTKETYLLLSYES